MPPPNRHRGRTPPVLLAMVLALLVGFALAEHLPRTQDGAGNAHGGEVGGTVALMAGAGLEVVVVAATGEYNVTVDGVAWLVSGTTPASFFGRVPRLHSITAGAGSPSRSVELHWADADTGVVLPWTTAIMVGKDPSGATLPPGAVVFHQRFIDAITNTSHAWPQRAAANSRAAIAAATARNDACGVVAEGTDQSGGTMCCGTPGRDGSRPGGFRNYSVARCCAACVSAPSCNAYIVSHAATPDDPTCWLIAGSKGSYPRADRGIGRIPGRGPPPPPPAPAPPRGGGAAGDQDAVLAGFPAFRSAVSGTDLNYLGWGGCQLSPGKGENAVGTHIGRWTGGTPLATAAGMTPFMLFDGSARALVMSPADNFFVGIHSTQTAHFPSQLQAGIKATVESIPKGFGHTTLLFGGHGINDTLIGFGDVLLAKSGKPRVDPYSDFVLGHLGHWNDAGGYYYHNPSPFSNYEEALLAVKADAEARRIPFRYSQWDDWWSYQHDGDFGNDGGEVYWWPEPSVFPSGLTDWLGWPVSFGMSLT